MLSNRGVKYIFSLAIIAITATFSMTSQATPAFARQMGQACLSCHFQHFPTLNAHGQKFKAGGYTEMGKQGTLKGEGLSLPSTLNASLFTKIRYQTTNGSDLPGTSTAGSGQLQFPDEFALLFGGRISDNIGFMLEGQLANGAAPFLAGFKMPFMYDVKGTKVGVIPYTTDALGAAYGFELLSTGAVRNIRTMEHRNESSAQQYIGTATAAMGVAFVAWNPDYFVNVSKWSPNNAAVSDGLANGNPSSTYVRAAYTPTLGTWETAIGGQYWGGHSNVGDVNDLVRPVDTKAWAIDAQAQGSVMNLPLGVYFSHANAKGSPVGGQVNLFNGNVNDKRATAISAELGVVPNKATIMLAYRNGDNGKATNSSDNAVSIGATYSIAQNVQLQFQHSNRTQAGYEGTATGGDKLTTFMLSSGF
ncbi:MAG: hypothetical protein ABL920_04040 [Methylotenera sp.]